MPAQLLRLELAELRAKVELASPDSGADDDERKQVDVRNDATAADWLRAN